MKAAKKAPVGCSGWFGADCAEEGRADRIHPRSQPPRPEPGGAGHAAAAPPAGASGGRPAAGRRTRRRPGNRPPRRPTPTRNNRPSAADDNYLSATEDQHPVGGERRTTSSAAGAAERQSNSERLTAAPVCCSGWFGTDCAGQSRDDQTTASPPPPRQHPGRAMPSRCLTAPRDGRASAARPVGRPLQPPPLPTTTTSWPSSSADNGLSATEGQDPVGVRVPNDPLSRRGMAREAFKTRDGCPGRLQRLVRRGPRPKKGRAGYNHSRSQPPRPRPASRATPGPRHWRPTLRAAAAHGPHARPAALAAHTPPADAERLSHRRR